MTSPAALLVLRNEFENAGEFLEAYKAKAAEQEKYLSIEEFVQFHFRGKLWVMDGNHRWDEKQRMLREDNTQFYSKPHWNLTPAQIFVGLTPHQAV